ncbi:MAG: prepilin-type N-terminal cleavage/methylation domain-containing protein, partial [Deltaproteobacteria bacterium]|nr:prepilin-type N-terminal cleavage/methylation domain-containing protein [Deltaproteobacteria bacterium]
MGKQDCFPLGFNSRGFSLLELLVVLLLL